MLLHNGELSRTPSLLIWSYAPKLPITSIRLLIAAVNRLDKPRKLTRTPPVTRRTLPVTTNEQRSLQRVIRRLMEVIDDTLVRNEA